MSAPRNYDSEEATFLASPLSFASGSWKVGLGSGKDK
ncbi:hypothetical protein TIFTF001_033504 [Ficus carica]|uniref:Uncharacterized protein n=1 Tax=Ficus carica TaxID=3494 RepID=A0AA88E5F4_FICCA|nr:hypothetical protein TIFTF001_033504 [Ficus carica]